MLVAAIAGGATRAKAAAQAGVSEATVYRRLQDATFRQLVQAARSEMVDQTSGRLTALSSAVVEKLVSLMLTARSETVQLAAASRILDASAKWRESEEIEARLSALEQLAAPQRTEPRRVA